MEEHDNIHIPQWLAFILFIGIIIISLYKTLIF